MKAPKLKFSLPKISLPKISLPKISLPKIGLPKIALPKISVPKFGEKAKAAEAEYVQLEVDDAQEGDGGGKRKFGLPKFKGKAKILVSVAAALLLAGGGGGGYFAWRMLRAAPKAEAQAQGQAQDDSGKSETAAHDKPAEAAASEHGEAKEAKAAEAAEAAHGAEDHGAPAQEGGGHEAGHDAANHDGANHEATSHEGKEHGGGEHEGGGHEGGGKKEKFAVEPLPPPPPPGEIETLVRELESLQERVSRGDGIAYQQMPKHLKLLGRKVFEAAPETWEKKENAHALIVYLLSGGKSQAGRKALAAPKFFAADQPIAKAAVAYLENIEGPDRDYMLSLDPMNLDPTLGASIAFVQSILLTPRDRDAALAKLDVARLLAPGGLVEEAALRREISLLAEERQYQRFAALARQYWERFRASPYAENFLRQFTLGVARVATSIKLEEWRQLDDFIESLTPETRRNLYLTVAQYASVVGNVDLAKMAADRARDLSDEASPERQRALVYGALAKVGAADSVSSAHLLDGVERTRLPSGDQPLYDAAAYVSGRIFLAPAKNFKQPPPGDPDATDGDLKKAEQALAGGDAAIEGVKKTMSRKRP